jgi:hypothetical protein
MLGHCVSTLLKIPADDLANIAASWFASLLSTEQVINMPAASAVQTHCLKENRADCMFL